MGTLLSRSTMASLLCSIMALACHHTREPIAHPLDGVEFRAHARVAGAKLDTLAIDIVAVNRSEREKVLEFSSCGSRPGVSLYRIAEKKSAWGMDRWQDSEAPSPASPFRIQTVCILSLIVMSLPAGATSSLGAIALPLQVVFGDSLATGSYRVTSMPGPINYRGKPIDAGTVELERPAEARDVIEHMKDRIARHDLRGIVVLTGRSTACVEMRGMSSETFYFTKFGPSGALDTLWDDQ